MRRWHLDRRQQGGKEEAGQAEGSQGRNLYLANFILEQPPMPGMPYDIGPMSSQPPGSICGVDLSGQKFQA